MSKPIKVLLVDDSEEESRLVLEELERGGYRPEHLRVANAWQLRQALGRGSWDLILSDFRQHGFGAREALEMLQEVGLDIPFIVVSGEAGEERAAEAMRAGASDYLMKGRLARLVPAVERDLREAQERRMHRRTQEAVLRGNAEWQAVFDAVSDLILITDEQGIITRCNKRVSDYFPGGLDAAIGRRIDELFFGDQPKEDLEFRFGQGGVSDTDEDIRFPNLKGWYNVGSYPTRFEWTDRLGFVFIIKDITKRREVEEEKRKSDRELRTLYAVAFGLQYIQGMEKMMGDLLFQLHSMLHMNFSFIHLFDRGRLKLQASLGLSPPFKKAMSSIAKGSQWWILTLAGRPFLGEGPSGKLPQRAQGAAVEMGLGSWCSVPLKVGPEVIGVMTVATGGARSYNVRDIFLLSSIAGQLAVLIDNYNLYDRMKEKAEELYRSQEELRANLLQVKRANLELGRLNTVKNNFIGIASHELKTPITSILGGVEFLLKYSNIPMTPEQHGIFVSVYEGIVQLRRLVEDLLSISRLEAQGPLKQKKPVNLISLCRQAHEMFVLPLSERSIRVRIAGEEASAPVDERFALLAVRNLLENAIKFTPDGGEVALTGRLLKRSDLKGLVETVRQFYHGFPHGIAPAKLYYLLEVRDSGIGIPVDERLRIFDKFYGVGDIAHHSSGNTAFMSKGSGLGLSIVRGIMDVHEGAVWVEGDGGGSIFSLLFPVT